MDITTNSSITATTTTTTTTAVKTPEAETETPTRIQPTKPLSFSNGVLKRHQPLHHHHHHGFNNNHHTAAVSYKECLKNHAASLGGHAVDGCGEFMPSPTATPTDPTSLKCAACGCHRNFHRREPEESLHPTNTTAALEYQPHHRHHPLPPPTHPPPHRSSGGHSSPSSPSPPPISSSYYPSAHMLLALSAGLSGPPQDGNLPMTPTGNTAAAGGVNPNGRKRFRTKFTQDQKDKMLEFAERVGWKMQKRDEELIADFCNEIGVDKGVLKVWMHNNKNTFGRKDQANTTPNSSNPTVIAAANNGNSNTIDFATHFHQNHESNNDDKNSNSHSQDLSHHLHNSGSNISAHVVATNGSSSSS